VITILAPAGIGEVTAETDLPQVLIDAVQHDPAGPLADGDILVVTSKILSKAEGRTAPEEARDQVIDAETRRTVARHGPTRIVRTRTGLVLAAAGVDRSNVAVGTILLLPEDPDGSAARLRAELQRRSGLRLGVVISDTAGRAWREGQTDHAIGAAGVQVFRRYAGELDGYGNRLEVTATALADELAAAADLAKAKLDGRPLAVVRGLGDLVGDQAGSAADLVRPTETDLFGYGSRESVLAAVLAVTGHQAAYERLVQLDGTERVEKVIDLIGADGAVAELLRALLELDLARTGVISRPR
jgi:coenzyme F420-0:L-glutamate ligase / coenzyme F420-1:gamma-L-glutamate ligase